MDSTRGAAVLLVVLFQSATLMRYADADAPAAVTAVNQALAPFRIPTLVFLSGLLVTPSLRKGVRRYLGGKLRNVA